MRVSLVVVGLGNVGRRFLELIERKRALLRERFNLEFIVTGASDSSGAAVSDGGLDLPTIIDLKCSDKGIADYPQYGRRDMSGLDLVRHAATDVLVENTLTNLKDGEPGISIMRTALERNMDIATANKGPLVLAYQELFELAAQHGKRIYHSATVCGGLPVVNIGRRDLGVCEFSKFEGIVNGTTNHILSAMSEGETFEHALKHMQELGIAEADPSLDVDGWDAANKLTIVANAVLRLPTRLSDISVQGIRSVTPADIENAKANGQVIKLVARAQRTGTGQWERSVRPEVLERSHPLASVEGGYMGVLYETDINGQIFAWIKEDNPYPTAAAVLRDAINLSQDAAGSPATTPVADALRLA